MASQSTKIIILLIIDVLFFLIELIVGYAVGSLALVADSFHMLNDVMSLIVALYAIRLSSKSASTKLSYGYVRAEVLAALINGVFLLALCFSIFMEAIERFFSVPEVKNPMLVVIVGCCGLASNILGLFLFHEHGHSHGSEGGHSHAHAAGPSALPKVASPATINGERELLLTNGNGTTTPPLSPLGRPTSRPRADSSDSISLYGHPVQTRAKVIATAQDIATSLGKTTFSPPVSPTHIRSGSLASASGFDASAVLEEEEEERTEGTATPHAPAHRERSISHQRGQSHSHAHSHSHSQSLGPNADLEMAKAGGQSHHHGNMNMRALLLHVLGDALGNVGVISSGLIIWQTTWSWKYYSDPMISLLITIIIFSSALPLVKSASFILLQGVPEDIKLDDLRADISNVHGVISVHELHVWQLSETRHIASVHIRIKQKADYMQVVQDIRRVLHRCGIHNATIQPEFGELPVTAGDSSGNCMVGCPPGVCNADSICCPPAVTVGDHDHDH